jgi:hypothetical protein
MSVPTSVADVIQRHVTLTVECLDRLYLNVIQSRLQVERGITAHSAATAAELQRLTAEHGAS